MRSVHTPAARLTARLLAGPLLAGVVIAAIAGGGLSGNTSYTVSLAAVYAIAVLAVSLLAGWAGVWSVGHPALIAIGAYTAAFGSQHGWGLEPTALVAMGLAALSGAFLGYAGARFSVLYIALLTLAFDLVVLELVGRFAGITGGDQGTAVGPLPSRIGLPGLVTPNDALYAPIVVLGVLLAITVLVRRSALRMRLVAAKSHPIVSRGLGIAPEAQTALAFAASGAVSAVAGILLGASSGFVSPEPFSLALAINIIAAAVLGGVGSTSGALVGGAFMAWSPELAADLGISQPYLQGGLLIVLLIFMPRGVVPTLQSLVTARWRRSEPPVSTDLAEIADAAADSEPRTASQPAILAAEGVTVRFKGLTALQDVALSVRSGEILGIIGPNGAGKTTLINTLSGFHGGAKVTGTIRYGDRDLLRTRATRRRGLGVGRTFQHAELFSELSILENVLCADRFVGRGRRADAYRLLERVGVAAQAHRLPAELPFGLQKRADLARAIAESPSLLLMDEPFGGLDRAECAIMRRQIETLRRAGTTVVIVDHVLDELFQVADRVVAFDFGTPIAEGTTATILHEPQVRLSYMGEGRHARAATAAETASAPIVSLRDIGFHYGGVRALDQVDLDIARARVLGIVGANGAGKSTLGRIIAAAQSPTTGRRTVDPKAPAIVCGLVPEGRALFRTLSIRENLEVAAYGAGLKGPKAQARMTEIIEWLPPRLRERLSTSAGSLSGGEQQMLAIARGLVSAPDVLILDEPSLGLAPMLVDEVYDRISELSSRGMTVVLLEQLLARAVGACDEIAILRDGAVVATGRSDDADFVEEAERAYFGSVSADLIAEGPAA